MLTFCRRKKIDTFRWNNCIQLAQNSLPYGYSWYLDATTDGKWDGLIWGDYEAVMPLPYNRKLLGFKQVYHPFFSQQLGVFSKARVSKEQVQSFFATIPKSYLKVYTQIQNTALLESIVGFEVTKKPTYLLNLKLPYLQLFKNYSKGLKYNLKQAKKQELTIQKLNISTFLDFFQANPVQQGAQHKQRISHILNRLLHRIEEETLGYPIGARDKDNELIGAFFLLKTENRLIYLLARSNGEGRTKKAMPFLLDTLIQQYANQDYILDFEGSSIPSLAKFFRSFDAKERFYYGLKRGDA